MALRDVESRWRKRKGERKGPVCSHRQHPDVDSLGAARFICHAWYPDKLRPTWHSVATR